MPRDSLAALLALVLLHLLPEPGILLYPDGLAGVELVAAAKIHLAVEKRLDVGVECLPVLSSGNGQYALSEMCCRLHGDAGHVSTHRILEMVSVHAISLTRNRRS